MTITMARLCRTTTCAFAMQSLHEVIRPKEHRRGERDVEGVCRLEIDDQLELRRLLHGKVGRLRALQDAIGVCRRTPIQFAWEGAVRHEPTCFDESPKLPRRREAVARHRCDHALYLVGYAHFETEELDAQRV